MRLFVASSQINDSLINLSDDQYHYLSRVLRIRKKECLDVVVDELELLNIEFRGFIGSKMQYEKLNSNTFKSDFLEISLIQSIL